MKLIYDLGANNGDNLPYYLLKAERVVAVEANPVLADLIRERFAAEIAEGRLVVENAVLIAGEGGKPVPFHINTMNHRMSRFPEPVAPMDYGSHPSHYRRVELPSISLRELIARHGEPDYIKIDLEYYDAVVLRDMFANGIFPPLISTESQDIAIFLIMVTLGGYDSFKLIDGSQVGRDFRDHPILTREGPARHSFPDHAAGPCGDDLPGQWLNANSFFRHLALHGIGWRDIHASRLHKPVSSRSQTLLDYIVTERIPAPLQGMARAGLRLATRLTAKPRPAFERSIS